VLDRDDRLELINESDSEIVVFGYDGEPYLRFAPEGVYRNRLSPATYLNEDRYAAVELPAEADPEAPPDWELVSRTNRYDWHDHRIHWMSPIDPPQVRAAPDEPHPIFDWEVVGQVEGSPLTIAGSLDYAPVDSPRPAWIFLAIPLAAIALAAGAAMLIRKRRARRTETESS
jgi:hypothetical protein